MQPIWKDYYVTLGSSDAVDFRITANGEVIYTGRSVKRPEQDAVRIRINDICADFLANTLPTMSEQDFSYMVLPVKFGVETLLDGEWDNIDEVEFINDWSYDYDHEPLEDGVAFPVNGRIAPDQWVVWTGLNVSQVEASVILTDGSTFSVIIPVAISEDFNADFNSDFARSVRSAASGTAVFKASSYGDVAAMVINGVRYDVADTCSRYALYYVNAYGGWDSLLIEGNHSEVDTLTRWTREVEYDNRNVQNRGRYNHVNEIVKSLTLHTSWLSDEQSARMHHLLNSTDVYLGDIATGAMIPVVLTDTQTEYKTYKGNGGRLVNYAINVTIAQERIRR